MRKPVISIVLPTYNRARYIPLAIRSILNQDFDNFELLVLDNASTDDTAKVVGKFKDKRIRYIKNKKNLGYPMNLKKGFLHAKGTYIFTISDDDIIVRKDTFTEIAREMRKKQAGFGELALMYYDSNYFKPSVLDHVRDELIYIPANKKNILKTLDWHFGFVSGNIFRRDLVKEDDLIDDIWFPYFKAIYRLIIERGAIYFGHHFIDARNSSVGLISYVDINKNKGFYIKKLFEIYKLFDRSKINYRLFVKNRLDIIVGTFAGIKYYTSNKNILKMMKEVIGLRPAYLWDLKFWMNSLTALILPKYILNWLRLLRTYLYTHSMEKLTRRIELESHLKEVLKKHISETSRPSRKR